MILPFKTYLPVEVADMFGLMMEINKLNLPGESIAARQLIQKTVQPFYGCTWFIEQFKFCTANTKINVALDDLVDAWILNGHWQNVGAFQINKIGGWLNTTGKTYNQKQKSKNGGAGKKAKFSDDI